MAKDFSGRVNALRARRQGLGISKTIEKSLAANSISLDSIDESVRRSAPESYETRTRSVALKYALGAMQEVDKRYTEISVEEATRISNQVINGIAGYGGAVSAELQGSLPMNVHLRRVSDVDVLVLPTDFCVYNPFGSKAHTYNRSNKSTETEITQLRDRCARVLREAYPAATVDNSPSKCITVTGGSLRRDADVVPALWLDTAEYQNSQQKVDRAVNVYDKSKNVFVTNHPFKVKYRVDTKDVLTNGGCKKAIRLLKNLKADAEVDIAFSSFDIMSVVYSMDNASLSHSFYLEGKILLSVRDWMKGLISNVSQLQLLEVVDGSRKIIGSEADQRSFYLLYLEVDDLVSRIAEELSPAGIKNEKVLGELIF